ncbi:Uncharacterized protein HZ326_13123 [Fusarium oxysporum f. sp. albedinis]|nr:Uncharacterized protein HZ326_13123 [Fusarium oxysporum f. sp. albedinis]
MNKGGCHNALIKHIRPPLFLIQQKAESQPEPEPDTHIIPLLARQSKARQDTTRQDKTTNRHISIPIHTYDCHGCHFHVPRTRGPLQRSSIVAPGPISLHNQPSIPIPRFLGSWNIPKHIPHKQSTAFIRPGHKYNNNNKQHYI